MRRRYCFGAVGTAGQRCTSSLRRVIMHSERGRRADFDKLVSWTPTANIRIGNPLDSGHPDGPAGGPQLRWTLLMAALGRSLRENGAENSFVAAKN